MAGSVTRQKFLQRMLHVHSSAPASSFQAPRILGDLCLLTVILFSQGEWNKHQCEKILGKGSPRKRGSVGRHCQTKASPFPSEASVLIQALRQLFSCQSVSSPRGSWAGTTQGTTIYHLHSQQTLPHLVPAPIHWQHVLGRESSDRKQEGLRTQLERQRHSSAEKHNAS